MQDLFIDEIAGYWLWLNGWAYHLLSQKLQRIYKYDSAVIFEQLEM